MKTYTDLYPKVCSFPALCRAYQECRKGKREREYAMLFEKNLERNLLDLHNDLLNDQWRSGLYARFFVSDPKRRLINAPPFRDRIVHRAVSDILMPLWDPTFIYDSYACRGGKGTHVAVDRLQQFMRRHLTGSGYVLQLDVKSYFASINHATLVGLIKKKIRDSRLMSLVRQVVESYCDTPGTGIPLGNLTSQGFANIYLHELDMFAKHTLRIKQYIRYMDDVALVADDKKQLWVWRDAIEGFLADHLQLRLHPDKQAMVPIDCGADYLGYIVFRDYRLVRSRNVHRVYRNLEKMENGTFGKDALSSIMSWMGYSIHADAYHLNESIKRKHPFLAAGTEKFYGAGQ